ncbi:hypothetical protein FRC07_008900 [Ceratobasidium sp. 392]|nr:hypothetical protein FRC07_008900 [Ceratobasidium sp. 392]
MPVGSLDTRLDFLNYFVHGDTILDVDVVRYFPNEAISDLIRSIQAAYFDGRRGDRIRVDGIFKINTILDEVVSVQLPPVDTCLSRIDLVSDHWSDGLDRKKVHILVKIASREPTTRSISGPPNLESSIGNNLSSDLSVDRIDQKLAELSLKQSRSKSEINKGPTPSAISKASVFHDQQHRDYTPIYNGRPCDKQGLPLQIYHPVFHAFTVCVQSAITPSSSDLRAVDQLLGRAQDTYKFEHERISAINDHLGSLLGRSINMEDTNRCKADGVIKSQAPATLNGDKGYLLIMEVKNEIGTGDADPSIQGAESFARYWSSQFLDRIREKSCCPSFILAIAGPWMCILGAVYVEQIVVHPLTDFIWLGRQVHESERLCQIARTFCALREGIESLEKYYGSLFTLQPTTARFFPCINQFRHPDGHDVVLDYFEVLATNPVRPVFRARIRAEPDELVVVKFVRDYNSVAHRMLADKRLAPRLLHDSIQALDCGLRMIVMESIEAPDLHTYLKVNRPTERRALEICAVEGDLKLALSLLHAQELVFGDLRKPNVLVTKKEHGVGGMLIDFDWCAGHMNGRYPASLNETGNTWAGGVTRGGLMAKEHDEYMLGVLFEPEQ